MDYHVDREIRLSEDSQYKNLYSWSLQEFASDGKKIGLDQIPWSWSLYFTASELRHNKSIRLEGQNGPEGEVKKNKFAEESQSITAVLHSGVCGDGTCLERDTTFSMFGTGRQIDQFYLHIYKLENGDTNERCNLWGCLSYTTDVDFHDETVDDTVAINLWLLPQRFEDLAEMVRSQGADVVRVRLGRVSGFYSEWSPSVSANSVKILCVGNEQNIVLQEGCDISPPRLGPVDDFEFSIIKRCILNPIQDLRATDILKVSKDDEAEESGEGADLVANPAHDEPSPNRMALDRIAIIESAIAKLRAPLWLIVIFLLLLFFK